MYAFWEALVSWMKPKRFDTAQSFLFLAFAGFFISTFAAAGLFQGAWAAGFFAVPAFPAFAGSGGSSENSPGARKPPLELETGTMS